MSSNYQTFQPYDPRNNGQNQYSIQWQPQQIPTAPSVQQQNTSNQAFLQQANNQQVQTPTPPLYGKFVTKESDIVPSDVPMNGSVSLFPQSDYSCIYAKAWDSDGRIKTIKYVPLVETQTNELDSSASNEILERLSKIENLLTKRPYYNNKKPNNRPYKSNKEVNNG